MQTVVGVFDSVASAQKARAALVDLGIGGERIQLSADLTSDAIGAEAPGQSYENQADSQSSSDTQQARVNTLVRTGGCTVSVESSSAAERRAVADAMRRAGARATPESRS